MWFDWRNIEALVLDYGIRLVAATVLIVVGWWVAGLLSRLTRQALGSVVHLDATVVAFLSSLAYYAALVLVFILMLQIVGIQATSLVAVVGAASLAIGLALQGTLSNMAAGVMLLLFRPFRLGDTVEVAGKSGTVRNLNLFMTELSTGDNIQVLVPNGQIWGAAITNLSAYPTRTASLTIVVPSFRDTEEISKSLEDRLAGDRRVLPTPRPAVTVKDISARTISLSVQFWANAGDADAVKADLARATPALIRASSRGASM